MRKKNDSPWRDSLLQNLMVHENCVPKMQRVFFFVSGGYHDRLALHEKSTRFLSSKIFFLPGIMAHINELGVMNTFMFCMCEIILQAKPRPEGLETLSGVVVDYNLPSLKGILQPVSGSEGGENKELLQFDITQLQCEGFRAVNKWTKVAKFSFIVHSTTIIYASVLLSLTFSSLT